MKELRLSQSPAPKTNSGNFFEDFRLGQQIRHATPRTVTLGDVALYNGLFGPRFAVQSSDVFAAKIGYPRAPLDDLLVFHMVFGKTVPDVSLNAVANLGYADCRFLKPVYPGDTLNAVSEVIGLKENSNKKTGIVYVRSRGFNQHGDVVLDYARWVMVRKRDEAAAVPAEKVPELPKSVEPSQLGAACPPIDAKAYDNVLAGSPHRFGDYKAGEKIDHVAGITVEDAEHMIATRLYQNTARIHFDHFTESKGRFGRAADLWRSRHFTGALAAVSTVSAMRFMWLRSMAAGTSRRCSQAARCSPGPRCWRAPIFPAARMSARCACAPSPPRTGRARIFHTSKATSTIRR